MAEKLKYNRQIIFFGPKGQAKLEKVKVAVVGVGGTGSHVLQQLAYLGVRDFILIDSDKVSETNLNRLVGANDQDKGKLKVDIGKRLIKFINAEIKVTSIPDTFVSKIGFAALKQADFIFGCLDKDGARLVLAEFCKAYRRPYLDIATEINVDNSEFGGRIVFSDSEKGCLICRAQLSQEEIHRDLSSPEDRSIDDKIYGIPMDSLKTSGPAVVSLNGILASIGVTELVAYVTGIRPIKRHLSYRGKMGLVTESKDKPIEDCYYCNSVCGAGDKIDIERYIRQGINKFLR